MSKLPIRLAFYAFWLFYAYRCLEAGLNPGFTPGGYYPYPVEGVVLMWMGLGALTWMLYLLLLVPDVFAAE